MAAKRHAQGLKLPSDINKKTVNDEELVRFIFNLYTPARQAGTYLDSVHISNPVNDMW